MKKLIFAFTMLSMVSKSMAQTNTNTAISLGDSVPDIEFTSLLYHQSPTARLSDFKGKAVLIDFWSTWCTPCIGLFPELNKLQKDFKDDLVIIAVTPQKRKEVEAFLKKKGLSKTIQFLVATDAKAVNKLFPHGGIPHEVWINKKRKVVAVTSSEYITAANVKSFVEGQPFTFIHKDENLSYKYDRSLEDNGYPKNKNQLLDRTTFYAHIPGLNTTYGIFKSDSAYFLGQINQTILELYRYALPRPLTNFYRQFIIEVKNRDDYIYNENNPDENRDEWDLRNTYCYQINSRPLISDSAIKAKMTRDLDHYFNLYGRLEKRICPYYKLVTISHRKKTLKSSSQKSEINWEDKGMHKNIYNKPMQELIDYLNGGYTLRKDVFEFTNATAITYNIDIELTIKDIGDIETLRTQLQPYGLDIIIEQKVMEVFVLSER